jgi:hypothetical protein
MASNKLQERIAPKKSPKSLAVTRMLVKLDPGPSAREEKIVAVPDLKEFPHDVPDIPDTT